VTTYHGAYSEGAPMKRRYNAVMASGDRVIAISRYIAELVRARHGVGEDRLRLIPRGVDTGVFDPDSVGGNRLARLAQAWRLPDGMRTVVLPGRLSRWKGQATVIEAVARLARRDVVCVLVGPDQGRHAYVRELVALAERMGLADRLRIAGPCDDMPAAMMLSDVVVHASIDPEPFGRVVIEAQAMGRPVIASDHGGPVETIEPGLTGWRVPPGDPAALAEALDYVLALPEEWRAQLAANARAAVAAGYTTRAMQDATLDVYRELL
jgi:glycosyltransferase involved in cell wall biosynthesis